MNKLKNMDKNKQFALVSLAIFGVITVLSIIFFKTCSSDYCDFNWVNMIHIFIITFGIIGLTYCFFILKEFNTKIDDSLIPHYKQILLDDDKDKDNKLSYEKKKDDNILSF